LILQAGGLSFLDLGPERSLKASSEMGSVAVLETSPTRKTLTQQQAIERELGGPESKALVRLYKLVYCRFCIFLLEEVSWD